MNKYGFFGKFKAYSGQRDALVTLLLEAAKLVSTAKGYHQYIVYTEAKSEDVVCVSEIWDSKEDHDNALKIEGSMELIMKARPLIEGAPETVELEVMGGSSALGINN